MKLWAGLMTSRGWDSHRTIVADGAEVRWLLDVARGLGTTHVAIVTELVGTSLEVLVFLDAEIRARGMTSVIWTSKALTLPWNRPEAVLYVRQLAEFFPDALFDIGREVDYLWQIHHHAPAEIVGALWRLKLGLLEGGIPPERIMAGGHTVAGAIMVDAMGPGWITVTGYEWVDEAYRRNPAQWVELLAGVVTEGLLNLREQTDPSHRIAVVEMGWPAGSGEGVQAAVIRETSLGIQASGVVAGAGFWTLPTFVNCGDGQGNGNGDDRCTALERSFGLLGPAGNPRPAFYELASAWA